MAMTRAQKMRAERQENLREFLSKQKLVEHVIDLANKMEQPEADIQALKASADTRMKLINKYLPDMKFVEGEQTLTGDLDVRSVTVSGTSSNNT